MKREKGKGIKAWEITEELWEKAEPLIPNGNGLKERPIKGNREAEGNPYRPEKCRKVFFCPENRDLMEGIIEGIRRGRLWPSVFQRMGGSGILQTAVGSRTVEL